MVIMMINKSNSDINDAYRGMLILIFDKLANFIMRLILLFI